jgi:hypothetical protein
MTTDTTTPTTAPKRYTVTLTYDTVHTITHTLAVTFEASDPAQAIDIACAIGWREDGCKRDDWQEDRNHHWETGDARPAGPARAARDDEPNTESPEDMAEILAELATITEGA